MNRFDDPGSSGPAAARPARQRHYGDLSSMKGFRTCPFQICRQTRASVDNVFTPYIFNPNGSGNKILRQTDQASLEVRPYRLMLNSIKSVFLEQSVKTE